MKGVYYLMMVDFVLTNGIVFNTALKCFEKKNIAIIGEVFYYISTEELSNLTAKEVIDLEGKYVVPGLVDIHMHIESSMIPPSTFSGVALAHGTTSIVADPHEIANVFGIEGIKQFLKQETKLDIYYAIPSSVPSTTSDRETTGGIISLQEVSELLKHPKIIALGEAMNFKGITSEPDSLIQKIIRLVKQEYPLMPLEGHIPRVSGEDLAKFVYLGLTADHTHQTPESIVEKVSNGIFIELQKKSIIEQNINVINQHQLYDHVALVTDDIMPDDLISGHLNANLKLAVDKGLSVENAIYMSTYTPARRMGFRNIGMIAPGYLADFIILSDLKEFIIESVYKKGQLVHKKNEQFFFPAPNEDAYPTGYKSSIRCKQLTLRDLSIKCESDAQSALCNVISIQQVGTFTSREQIEIPIINGELAWQDSGLCLILVMERYGKNGQIGYGLVKNTLNKKGAIATTWAHDHHNLMVMGNDLNDIMIAQSKLLDIQGGYVVVSQQNIDAVCPLPIGGIISDEPLPVVSQNIKNVRGKMKQLGYKNTNEIMSFSTLSLPVSPQIKITDFGMMDVHNHELIPIVERYL